MNKSRKKKITLIAEIGENHLGNIKFAKKMISQTKKAGADFAKFQSYNQACLKKSDPEYNWFKKVSLSDKNHFELSKECNNRKIKFIFHTNFIFCFSNSLLYNIKFHSSIY